MKAILSSSALFLAAALLSVLLCQCDDGSAAKLKGLREEIDQLNDQKRETALQLKRLQTQMDSTKEQRQRLEEDKKKIEAERDEAMKRVEQLQKDFEAYKASYKVSMRNRAPGLRIDDFTTIDGKAYRNVVLRELTDTYVNFSHESGIVKVPAGQLPERVKEVLGFTISNKAAAEVSVAKTPRQINAQRKAEYGIRLDELDDKIKVMRGEKNSLLKELGTCTSELARLTASNSAGQAALRRTAETLRFELSKLENQIMQAEVERFEAGKRSPVLVEENTSRR